MYVNTKIVQKEMLVQGKLEETYESLASVKKLNIII